MKILVTGTCGFIGFHIAKSFLNKGYHVIGIDNFDNYYSLKLKKKRNDYLKKYKNFKFTDFETTLTNTVKWYIKNDIHKF